MPAMPADVAHLRPLIYSLCEQREVPVLVTDLVARYLDEQDLQKINILSPTLNEQASSIIYKDVILDLSEETVSAKSNVTSSYPAHEFHGCCERP